MQRLLMIAFHYPPFQGGSGVHRTLKFSKYLPDRGWQPIVLSAHPRAYPHTGAEQLAEVPGEAVVDRAFALDSRRHLALRGRYLRVMALPDQWASWWWPAVFAGLKLVRKYRPSILWSTYPIATAHLIGLTLQRLTGLPWVADFRDSMTEEGYPQDVWSRRAYRWIEKQAVRHSSRLVFTAPSTRQMYLDRYPTMASERCLVIPNGYDEEDFKDLTSSEQTVNVNNNPSRLVHAGVVYPDDRDPRAFFNALSRLKQEARLDAQNFRIDLRASGSEAYYSAILKELGIDDLIHLLPALPYRQALQDCAAADALLLFQAASCNHQIPAKVYEYLRLKKPILALTSDQGDTAALLKEIGGATIVDLADETGLYLALPRFLSLVRSGTHPLPDETMSRRFARKHQALELSQCLSQLLHRDELRLRENPA